MGTNFFIDSISGGGVAAISLQHAGGGRCEEAVINPQHGRRSVPSSLLCLSCRIIVAHTSRPLLCLSCSNFAAHTLRPLGKDHHC